MVSALPVGWGWSIGDNWDEDCFDLSVRGNNGWVDVTKPDAKA